MLIGFITKRVYISKGLLGKYLHRHYDFVHLNLMDPVINTVNAFAHSQGHKPSENDIIQWHQFLMQSVDPEYRINYMKHILSKTKERYQDIVLDDLQTDEEIYEFRKNGGTIVFVTGCNCRPKSADHVIHANDIIEAYDGIDRMLHQYSTEKI